MRVHEASWDHAGFPLGFCRLFCLRMAQKGGIGNNSLTDFCWVGSGQVLSNQ